MIDTVVLILNKNMFYIKDPDMFEPSARWINDDKFSLGRRGYTTSKQNPTSNELKSGIYKPRLTITKRFNGQGYETVMKIEFSAPKLLFKNNFDEVEESDFDLLISTLQQKLGDMGVTTKTESLMNAPVSTIHYSKNVVLTDGLTSYSLLKEIQKSNITQRLDFNQTDFRNGYGIKFRTNSFEIAFYDKMKDMEESKVSGKRAIENDNAIQKSLFAELDEIRREKPLEIFRMEIRLNQRQKIRKVLEILKYSIEPTFKNLFKREVAQKVLFYYLIEIQQNLPRILSFKPKSSVDFIAQFLIDNPTVKMKGVLTALGFQIALDEIGSRELRTMMNKYPIASWYALIKKMNSYIYSAKSTEALYPIWAAINEFTSLKSNDLEKYKYS